jgi:hypothetical protein
MIPSCDAISDPPPLGGQKWLLGLRVSRLSLRTGFSPLWSECMGEVTQASGFYWGGDIIQAVYDVLGKATQLLIACIGVDQFRYR